MTVLYRCEEDNTLCMTEVNSIYMDGDNVFLSLKDGACRMTSDINASKFEKIMKESIHYRAVDFSEYTFWIENT